MTPLVSLTLKADDDAKITPLEALEDFADATGGWQYLEDESTHYAQEKGVPACVLRHRTGTSPAFVDFAFSDTTPERPLNIRLQLLDAPDAETALPEAVREAVVRGFLDAFNSYLATRPGHVSVQTDDD